MGHINLKKFFVNRDIAWGDVYAIYCINQYNDGTSKRQLARLVFDQDIKLGDYSDPTVRLELDEATNLMNELWNQGIRPTAIGSPGELASTKYHLEDMRKLVFKNG